MDQSLSWALPPLEDPTTIHVPANQTSRRVVLRMDPDRDYIIKMPDTPLQVGLALVGGRNVVLIGGEINIPWQGEDASIGDRTMLLIRDATGVVHIEGLRGGGEDLSEGIQIDAPDAIVQLQNIRIDNVHARDQEAFSDNHPDLIQTYGNVEELRIDGFTGSSDYQGIFLKADYGGPHGNVTIRNVNIIGEPTSRYLWWVHPQNGAGSVTVENVWIDVPAERGGGLARAAWPNAYQDSRNQAEVTIDDDGNEIITWPAHMVPIVVGSINEGTPLGGDFVPADAVGIGYQAGSVIQRPVDSSTGAVVPTAIADANALQPYSTLSGPATVSPASPAAQTVELPGTTTPMPTVTMVVAPTLTASVTATLTSTPTPDLDSTRVVDLGILETPTYTVVPSSPPPSQSPTPLVNPSQTETQAPTISPPPTHANDLGIVNTPTLTATPPPTVMATPTPTPPSPTESTGNLATNIPTSEATPVGMSTAEPTNLTEATATAIPATTAPAQAGVSSEPGLSCPADRSSFVLQSAPTTITSSDRSRQYTVEVADASLGELVIASMTGHPDYSCKEGSNNDQGRYRCDQGQSNEEFSVLVNSEVVGFVADHGEDRWDVVTLPVPELSSGTHSFAFQHSQAGGGANSVAFKAVLCLSPMESAVSDAAALMALPALVTLTPVPTPEPATATPLITQVPTALPSAPITSVPTAESTEATQITPTDVPPTGPTEDPTELTATMPTEDVTDTPTADVAQLDSDDIGVEETNIPAGD